MHIAGLACAFLLLATSSALVSRSLYDACSLTCGCMHKVGAEIAYQLGEIKISVAGLHNDFSQVKYKFQDASSGTNLESIRRKETDNKNLEAQIKSIAEEVKALKQGATHSTNSHNAQGDECSGKLQLLQQSSQAEKELLEQSLEQVNQSLSAAVERIQILNSSHAAVCNASSETIIQLNNTNQNLSVCLMVIKNLEKQLAERKDEIDWLRNATLREPDEKENKACDGEEERFQKEINSTTAEKEELERKLDAAFNELLTANETIQNLQDEYNKLRAEMVKTKMMGEERAPRDKGADIDKIEEDYLCDSVVALKQTIIENESVKRSLQTELQKINQTAANALERADDLQQKLDSANGKILEMETSLQNAQQEASNASKIAEDLEEVLQNNGSSLENSSETENQEQLEAAQKAAEEARENATRLFTELELKAHELAAAKERLEKEALCRKARRMNLITVNRKKYLIVKHLKLNWTEGLEHCASNGLELAILDQHSDLKAVMTATANITNWPYFWWVGASDIDRDPGDFQWLNGKPLPLNSTLWYAGCPNYYGRGEDTCVYFHTASVVNFRLHDVNCTKLNKFICQLPPECY